MKRFWDLAAVQPTLAGWHILLDGRPVRVPGGAELCLPGQKLAEAVAAEWNAAGGDKGGDKGFMVMSDAWFDEYLYEVVVDKSYLSSDLVALLDQEPEPLPPWDPMGSLAGSA